MMPKMVGSAFNSFVAIRVPPLQTTVFDGLVPRLTNTDLLSAVGSIELPQELQDVAGLVTEGLGMVAPIAEEAFGAVQDAIGSATDALDSISNTIQTAITNGVAGGLGLASPTQTLSDISDMASSLAGAGIGSIQSAIGDIMGNLPSIAGVMSSASSLVDSMGISLPSLPSLSSVFAPITESYTGGGLAGAFDGITSAVGGITSAVGGSISSLGSSIGGLTSGFDSSITNMAGMITNMQDQIQAHMSVMTTLSNAAVLQNYLPNAPSDYRTLIGQVSSAGVRARYNLT